MRSGNRPVRAVVFMIVCWIGSASTVLGQERLLSEPVILTLRPATEYVPDQVIPKDVRYLPDLQTLESYLVAMDGAPPPWESLAGPQGVGDEKALAQLNDKRDRVRQTRRLIKQRIAFVWSGKLHAYDETHKGFILSIGPENYNTSWGEVTFRPERLPPSLAVLPSEQETEALRQKLESGEAVPVRLLLFGRLSSILYGFSHEHRGVGSVIPRVALDEMQAFQAPVSD